jgi:hypothetical protein
MYMCRVVELLSNKKGRNVSRDSRVFLELLTSKNSGFRKGFYEPARSAVLKSVGSAKT